MKQPTPILFMSDAPDSVTGLGRISRDLAIRLSGEPAFRVGFLGLHGTGTRTLPFPQYHIQAESGLWGETTLDKAWDDFAGNERGIIFTIWDISRTEWIARPTEWLPDNIPIREWLKKRRESFKLWGYFPTDAIGPGGRFTFKATQAYQGYDRRLWYSRGALEAARRSLPDTRSDDWLPHGLDLSVFKPIPRGEARKIFDPRVREHDFLLGAVATNQPRKDFGLLFETAYILREALGGQFHLWLHTDLEVRYWDVHALVADYVMGQHCTVTTHEAPDEEMALRYSACNATMAPGLGEGFGYPIVESLACGIPVVHVDYAGGAEHIYNEDWRIKPIGWRLEGQHNSQRPFVKPQDFAEALLKMGDQRVEVCRAMISHLDWERLWPAVWRKWFLGGLI
jgi:glycosyltransferase involved in cell wall biosynthesis